MTICVIVANGQLLNHMEGYHFEKHFPKMCIQMVRTRSDIMALELPTVLLCIHLHLQFQTWPQTSQVALSIFCTIHICVLLCTGLGFQKRNTTRRILINQSLFCWIWQRAHVYEPQPDSAECLWTPLAIRLWDRDIQRRWRETQAGDQRLNEIKKR